MRNGSDLPHPPPCQPNPTSRWTTGPRASAICRAGWRLPRSLPGAAAAGEGGGRLLQDAPFYARSLLPAQWCGQPVHAMHEQLDLDRLQSPWVQAMLPFRMPRRAGP